MTGIQSVMSIVIRLLCAHLLRKGRGIEVGEEAIYMRKKKEEKQFEK